MGKHCVLKQLYQPATGQSTDMHLDERISSVMLARSKTWSQESSPYENLRRLQRVRGGLTAARRVLVEAGNLGLQTLPLPDGKHNLVQLGALLEGVAIHQLPVVKHTLREGLAGGAGTKGSGETETLRHGQVGLDLNERGASPVLLVEDVTTTLVQSAVHTSHGVLRAVDVDKEHGLLKLGLGSQLTGVEAATAGGHDLTSASVDGISVHSHIQEVEANSTHVLVTQSTLLGSPLEGRVAVVLDFVQVLNTSSHVNHEVGASGFRTEAPNLKSGVLVPLELVGEQVGPLPGVVPGSDLVLLDGLSKTLSERLGLHEQPVVLVGRLGKTGDAGLGRNSLPVRDDRVRNNKVDLRVLVPQILQTNFDVELTTTSNDVLTVLLSGANDQRVRLGQLLQTLHQLGQVLGVLGLHGDTHDGRDGILHVGNVVGSFAGGNGTTLQNVLVNTNQTASVTTRDILNLLSVTTHHKHGALDVLDEQVSLLTGHVLGTLNPDLLTSGHGTGEDTTEGVETTLVRSRYHLRDVHHKRALRVTVADSIGSLVVHGTGVQVLHTVLLGGEGRRKVADNHLKKNVASREPDLHDPLEQGLASEVTVVTLELNTNGLELGLVLLLVVVHDVGEQTANGLHDEVAEGTVGRLGSGLGEPDLATFGEEVVTPEVVHHLFLRDTELGVVDASEGLNSEGPAVKTRAEGNGTFLGVDLDVAHKLVIVGGNDDVDVLNAAKESHVNLLRSHLKLQKSPVNLVDVEHRPDTLTERLTQHSLSLHTYALNGVDNNQSTVRDTEGSRHFGRKVNVTGRIDQVDEERLHSLTVVEIMLKVHGNTRGLDGDATLLLVRAGVGETRITGVFRGDNAGLGDKRIREGTLAVVDVRNHGHIPDVLGVTHDLTDLLHREVHHLDRSCFLLCV
ncbi:uncharacterized protein BcabD6B2_36150 [Babesia caballi]|uniref:Uncharacterized protein n=1 Tax=Babesia caballi TaxID=5871 RepID=A0AAV4LWB7_BABCB|nr:hypothetical protein BcabD6B2_36150 [Babesia caballi]